MSPVAKALKVDSPRHLKAIHMHGADVAKVDILIKERSPVSKAVVNVTASASHV